MITLRLGSTHYLVIILKELDDNPQVGVEVFHSGSSHHVGSILGVRVTSLPVGQDEARVSRLHLQGGVG